MANELIYILVSVVIISLISLVGIFSLLIKRNLLNKIITLLIAFAAGSLLGAAFFDLLPESIGEINNFALSFVVIGLVIFFMIEKFIHWHHCGKEDCKVHPVAYLNLIGDSIHNFLDGIIIAAGFLMSFSAGVTASIAIALHEIPQEIGDFAVMVHAGFKIKKALIYNFISAISAVAGGILAYIFLIKVESFIPFILAIAAGGFIYIATADLIPELHKERDFKKLITQTISLILGILLIFFLVGVFPNG